MEQVLSDKQINYILKHFIRWGHAKAGGHGGQHVNKRETKAEGYLDVEKCPLLTTEQKERIYTVYHNKVSKEKELKLTCQEERHLHRNMVILKKHFRELLTLLEHETLAEHHHGHR